MQGSPHSDPKADVPHLALEQVTESHRRRLAWFADRAGEITATAMDAGARGFLPKGSPPDDLVACVRRLAGGNDWCPEPLSV